MAIDKRGKCLYNDKKSFLGEKYEEKVVIYHRIADLLYHRRRLVCWVRKIGRGGQLLNDFTR